MSADLSQVGKPLDLSGAGPVRRVIGAERQPLTVDINTLAQAAAAAERESRELLRRATAVAWRMVGFIEGTGETETAARFARMLDVALGEVEE